MFLWWPSAKFVQAVMICQKTWPLGGGSYLPYIATELCHKWKSKNKMATIVKIKWTDFKQQTNSNFINWFALILCGVTFWHKNSMNPFRNWWIKVLNVFNSRDHFLARFRDIPAFFCKKSHQNSRSEKKNCTLNFSHFAPLSSYFAHAVHFETIGLFCLTGFWIIVAPKFISHRTAGNHSLICITEKLYRKISFSVSGLSKHFFDRYLESAKKNVGRLGKRKKENYPPQSRPVGMATC